MSSETEIVPCSVVPEIPRHNLPRPLKPTALENMAWDSGRPPAAPQFQYTLRGCINLLSLDRQLD